MHDGYLVEYIVVTVADNGMSGMTRDSSAPVTMTTGSLASSSTPS